jgi:hypothetical protein
MPKVTFNKFKALPPVCIITGAKEGVVFQRVTLTYEQRADPAVALTLMSRYPDAIPLSLPFTQQAYDAWQRSKWRLVACVVGASILPFFVFPLAIAVSPAFFALAAVAVPLVMAAIALKKEMSKGPRVTRVEGEMVELDIASAAAAAAIKKHAEEVHERDKERLAERLAKTRENKAAEKAEAEQKAAEKAEAEPKPPSKAAASLAEWAKRRRG